MINNSSMQLEAEENKLLKAAEGYKGTINIREQLMAEAATDGYTGADAEAIVSAVINRLNKTEKKKSKGSALGVAHDPTKRANNMATLISQLRSW